MQREEEALEAQQREFGQMLQMLQQVRLWLVSSLVSSRLVYLALGLCCVSSLCVSNCCQLESPYWRGCCAMLLSAVVSATGWPNRVTRETLNMCVVVSGYVQVASGAPIAGRQQHQQQQQAADGGGGGGGGGRGVVGDKEQTYKSVIELQKALAALQIRARSLATPDDPMLQMQVRACVCVCVRA